MSPLVPIETVQAAAPFVLEDPDGRARAGASINTCADCLHQTRAKTCGETEAAGLDPPGRFSIWWPPESYAADCKAFTGKAPTPAQERPYSLTNDNAGRCHTLCWDYAEKMAFTARTDDSRSA